MAKDGVKKSSKKVKKVAADEVETKMAEDPAVVEEVTPAVVVETTPAVVETTPEETAPVEEKVVEKPAEAKTEEKAEKVEEKKEEEPKVEIAETPKDVEADAPEDKRKRTQHHAAMNTFDTTLNALVSEDTILSTFQQGGLGFLLAGVRANIGVKSGRYYFEAKAVEIRGKHDIRIGFSTLSASLSGGDDKSFLFALQESTFHNGSAKPCALGKRIAHIGIKDVVGVLLNRVDGSEQNNTVSLFINGIRASEPLKIEAEGALYPHIVFKSCSLAANFKEVIRPLPFIVRPIADAAAEDVELSTVVASGKPEVVFPIGWDVQEYVTEFAAKNPTHEVLTTTTLTEWQKKSGARNINELSSTVDGGKTIGGLMRNRKYIVALSKNKEDGIFAAERKAMCSRFAGYKKIAKVMLGKTEKTHLKYTDVTLPSEGEGFDLIEYVKPKEECEAELEAWKADCKLRSLVEDLKVGTWYKEQINAVKKLVEEKKADKEAYKEFTPEDWMLVMLRAELHYIIHAFLADVNDDAREGFASAHLGFYYRKYNQREFLPTTFGMKSIEELVEDLLSDLIEIDAKTLMRAKLAKDCDQITFLEQAEADRNIRADRLDAGDENAALKFSARTKIPGPVHHPKGQSKGQSKGAANLRMQLGAKVLATTALRRPIPVHPGATGRPITGAQLRTVPQHIPQANYVAQKRPATWPTTTVPLAKRRR